MTLLRKLILYTAVPTFFLWMVDVQPVRACAVCFGDPESDMAKGAIAGIMVLTGFIGFVLLGVTGTGLYWIHRSRQLSSNQKILP